MIVLGLYQAFTRTLLGCLSCLDKKMSRTQQNQSLAGQHVEGLANEEILESEMESVVHRNPEWGNVQTSVFETAVLYKTRAEKTKEDS